MAEQERLNRCEETFLFCWFLAALAGHPVPMTPVGFAINLALMDGTRVVLSFRRHATGFLRDPLAIRVVPANDHVGLDAAWSAFGSSETDAGTGEQDKRRSDG